MPGGIGLLARDLLDERELQLGRHLADLIGEKGGGCARSLIVDILPTEADGTHGTMVPGMVYRPLVYLCRSSDAKEFEKVVGAFLEMISAHIEGSLRWLSAPRPTAATGSSGSFGSLAIELYRKGILPQALADQLVRFNKALGMKSTRGATGYRVGVVAPGSGGEGSEDLEAALALVVMRKLSIQLFSLFKSRGINLPKGWSEFKEEWLIWDGRRHGVKDQASSKTYPSEGGI